MPVFKVWTNDRMTRKCITTTKFDIEELKTIINEKFNTNAKEICMENDGTVIDDNGALEVFQKETLMFLEETQSWEHQLAHANSPTVSRTSSVSSLLTSGDLSEPPSPSTSDIEFNFDSFDFDLIISDIPAHIMKLLQDKKRLDFSNYALFIKIMVQNIRLYISAYSGRKNLKKIAEYLTSKYPKTFLDVDDDNVVIGLGYTSLLRKLEDRNNYLNRQEKREDNNLNKLIRRKRHSKNSQVGCTNWQPAEIPEGDTMETWQQKKIKLQQFHATNCDTDDIRILMNDTFACQRLFLNATQIPTIDKIKQEWPYLMIDKFIQNHMNLLTGCNVLDVINSSHMKFKKVIKYLTNMEINETGDNLLMSFISAVTDYFKENTKSFVIVLDVGTTRDEACKTIGFLTPCIIKINDTLFYVCVEKTIINDGYNNLQQAVADLFALYYILNIKYPEDLSLTLEFIQRYVFKINQTEGTKSSKKTVMRTNAILNKVLSLMNKLRDFSYGDTILSENMPN